MVSAIHITAHSIPIHGRGTTGDITIPGGASATDRHSTTGVRHGHGRGDGAHHGRGEVPDGAIPDGDPAGEARYGAAVADTTIPIPLRAHTGQTVQLPETTGITVLALPADVIPLTETVAQSITATACVHLPQATAEQA